MADKNTITTETVTTVNPEQGNKFKTVPPTPGRKRKKRSKKKK